MRFYHIYSLNSFSHGLISFSALFLNLNFTLDSFCIFFKTRICIICTLDWILSEYFVLLPNSFCRWRILGLDKHLKRCKRYICHFCICWYQVRLHTKLIILSIFYDSIIILISSLFYFYYNRIIYWLGFFLNYGTIVSFLNIWHKFSPWCF